MIIILPFINIACQNQSSKEKIKNFHPPKERPAQKSYNVNIIYSDSSKMKAILNASQMITYNKNQNDAFVYFPNDIKIIFYNNNQAPTSTLTANQAVYFTKSQKAYLKHNVTFINDKNEKLKTEDLEWNQISGKITTDKPVQIITPTQIIKGVGIVCEQDFSEYKLQNITGIVQFNENN